MSHPSKYGIGMPLGNGETNVKTFGLSPNQRGGGGEDHRENKTPVTVFLHPSCHHNLHEISHCLDNSIRAHNPLTEKVKRGGDGEVILANVFTCVQRGGSHDNNHGTYIRC